MKDGLPMLTIEDLAADRRTIHVDYTDTKGVHRFTVTWIPSNYTIEFARRVSIDKTLRTADFVCALVDSWELADVDGKMLPVTPDALGSWPLRLMQAIETALLEDLLLVGLPEASSNSAAG